MVPEQLARDRGHSHAFRAARHSHMIQHVRVRRAARGEAERVRCAAPREAERVRRTRSWEVMGDAGAGRRTVSHMTARGHDRFGVF
jgi:hypothetical protein